MNIVASARRIAATLAVLGLALSSAMPVEAQQERFGGRGERLRERQAAMQRDQPSRQEQRDARHAWRDQRQGDGAAAANGTNDRQDRPGRLSPEERRQLRRDIRDAGQDVYRPERFQRR